MKWGVCRLADEEEEADWPVEAYAAQAILARSFTMDYLEESGGNEIPAAHEQAQAYNPDNIFPAIEEGVDMTRGEVMMYNDEYVRAWFHSYSGGKTATAREGLGQQEEPPYIKSVDVGENEFAPEDVTDWEFSMTLAERAWSAGRQRGRYQRRAHRRAGSVGTCDHVRSHRRRRPRRSGRQRLSPRR